MVPNGPSAKGATGGGCNRLMSNASKDETPEEEVNLSALHECFLQKEKEIALKKLALPSFAQDQVPQEHPKVIALFKDFEAATPTERVQRCNRIKQEQKDYFASLGHKFSSHWGDLLWVLVPSNDEPAELMMSMLNARHEWFKQAALPIAKEQWNSRSTRAISKLNSKELLADNYAHHYGDYVHVRLLGHFY